jgi:hypothetical protein
VSEALFEKAEALVTSIFLHHSLDEIAPTLPSGRHESLEDPGFGSDDDQDDNDKDDELTRRKKKKMGKQREISTPSLFSEMVREAFMDELRVRFLDFFFITYHFPYLYLYLPYC